MKVYRRPNHSRATFLQRTVAAQLHGLAVVLAIVGMIVLLPAARAAGAAHFWACFAFLATGIMLFSTSSAYHFLNDGYAISPSLQLLLEDLDHNCIYLFIAGTYTPFLMNAVGEEWRKPLLIGIWVIAGLGILYTNLKPRLHRVLQSKAVYVSLFVMMGWMLLIRAGEVYLRLSTGQLVLMVSGAMAYMLGVVSYVTHRPKLIVGYFGYHELWHFMVLVGATLHFFFILSFY